MVASDVVSSPLPPSGVTNAPAFMILSTDLLFLPLFCDVKLCDSVINELHWFLYSKLSPITKLAVPRHAIKIDVYFMIVIYCMIVLDGVCSAVLSF